MNDISLSQLKQAVAIREEIESLTEKLISLMGGKPMGRPAKSTKMAKTAAPMHKGKRRMSAAGRARIAAAAKARWAKFRNGTSSSSSTTAAPVKTKRTGGRKKFNAAARARLSEAAKARWAKAKASGKSTL